MSEIESEVERAAGSMAYMAWLMQQPKVPEVGTIFAAGWVAGRDWQRAQEEARFDAVAPRDHICGPRTSPGLKTRRETTQQPVAAAEEDR